jgi:ATP-dependent helicase/nuclease subunit A
VTPPDQPARDRILADLGTTLLVEAAAGTGKTTSLAGRMVALVRTGACELRTLAAVTFTRKAAAELRSRFSADLERAAAGAAGAERERLAAAAARSESCFIGTIHAFCARLLRERPIEAGVDVAFAEIEETGDALLREEAWARFVGALFAAGDARIGGLLDLGLEIGDLKPAFLELALYPDVEEWPAPAVEPEELAPVRAAFAAYIDDMRRAIPGFPEERGTDELMGRYERVSRVAGQRGLARAADLMAVAELFEAKHGGVQKCWPDKKQGKEACDRWADFSAGVARPLLARWRARRYAAIVPLLREAAAVSEALRAERGVLNYQDLLLKAARLLRSNATVRAYFRERFTHLLVDEFQDTDPLQAEVVLSLTADDPREADWRRCRPVPGSLFVVGDPKQSIYRFRRADIATYNRVKGIITAAGGAVLSLDTNFRTLPDLVAWANGVFAPPTFPAAADTWAPAAHPLAAGRAAAAAGHLAGLRVIDVPEGVAAGEAACAHDARRIARFIRHALDERLTVARSEKELRAGALPAAGPGDFLVVTWHRKHLDVYAAALQELGIPHRVSGGSAWGQVEELGLLAGCLRALVEPENPVALVALLRGRLFGLSDAELYDFHRAGGRFSLHAAVPEGLDAATAARLGGALERLRRHAGWLRLLPPVAAAERIAEDLGLVLRALARPGGDVRAGSIGKAFALLREAQREVSSVAGLVAALERFIAEGADFDGVPARAEAGSAVRVMNLHKVKGLEAPVVFLADPTGKWSHPVSVHVDREGDRIRGYLAIGKKAGRAVRPLAHPGGWEAHAEAEGRFAAAEKTRLLYVAATRAGSLLAVTRWPRKKHYNWWDFFSASLRDAPPLPDPGEQRAPATAQVVVPEEAVDAAAAAIAGRWEAVLRDTYAVRAAKEIAVSAAELHRHPAAPGAEHGAAWGTVIHFLLETALREPGRDLRGLARAALEEQELDPALADAALATVAAVQGSAIWRRATAAQLRLVEAPFVIGLDPADPLLGPGGEPRGLPTVVRGVVDLAFREPAGWVIVDWKTDAGAAARQEALVEHYRGQIELYARVFARVTGEAVAECGLFFVATGAYVALGG